MISESQESQAVVTREDQNDINRFARLLNERIDTERTLRARQELLKLHEEASDELLLIDDDQSVQHVIGDVFLVSSKSHVDEILESQKSNLHAEVEALSHTLDTIQSEMKGLKSRLYAKFGQSINLEDES